MTDTPATLRDEWDGDPVARARYLECLRGLAQRIEEDCAMGLLPAPLRAQGRAIAGTLRARCALLEARA